MPTLRLFPFATISVHPIIMFRRLIVILSAHFLAACTIFHQGNTVNIADLPVAVVSHDILLDGGSVELTVRDAAGRESRYLRRRSLDIQGTPRYNSITAENGRML